MKCRTCSRPCQRLSSMGIGDTPEQALADVARREGIRLAEDRPAVVVPLRRKEAMRDG